MIEFNVANDGWAKDEKALATRIAAIVVGMFAVPQLKDPNRPSLGWQLDRGNDWCFHKAGENSNGTTSYQLNYRYSPGYIEELKALRAVIIWRLGLQHIN